jgi:hypothetical protein
MAGHIIHAIIPGDHYLPRNESAIPTVVDGLARAALAASGPEQAVLTVSVVGSVGFDDPTPRSHNTSAADA